MRKIGKNNYLLNLLDTCIVSEIIKYPEPFRLKFVQHITKTNTIPCISIWTILELRKSNFLYEGFLDLFSIIPFLLLKTPNELLKEELASYPNTNNVDPILYAFTFLNENQSGHLRKFLGKFFEDPENQKVESSWNELWRQEALSSIIKLKPNFPPSGEYYTSRDAARFIQAGVPQYIFTHAPEWAKQHLNSGKMIQPDAFPSVKMIFYTVFYRFYAEQREPELQDIFDILISGVVPYLDAVVTEKFQAEIFRKVKRKDSFLKDVDVETLSKFAK